MTQGHLLFHHWLVETYGGQDKEGDRPRYAQAKDDPDGPRGIQGFVDDVNKLLDLERLGHVRIKKAPQVYPWLVQSNAKHPRRPNAAIQLLIQKMSLGVVPAQAWSTPLTQEHME